MAEWIAGVDGCPAGWIVVLVSTQDDIGHRLVLCKDFNEILHLQPTPKIIAIDIPIGLHDERVVGGRDCDREARKLLGRPRSSSVFSAPPRAALSARTYDEARPHGLTLQAFGILPKISEVDAAMTASLRDRVLESHPALAFFSMSGRPMRYRKKSKLGREERLEALVEVGDEAPFLRGAGTAFEKDRQRFRRKDVALDDIVDAYAMAWVAFRVAAGTAKRLPETPPKDSNGLRMEIWY